MVSTKWLWPMARINPFGFPNRPHKLMQFLLLTLSYSYVLGRGVFKSPTSCAGSCTSMGPMEERLCQCDPSCVLHGDCCSDYEQECLSCGSRCAADYDPRLPCQCHWSCEMMGPCCKDYLNEADCALAMPNSISDKDLYALSERLWNIDVTLNPIFLNLSLGESAVNDAEYEKAGDPLFPEPIDEEILSRPTAAALMRLFDNYHAVISEPEQLTNVEIDAFINAVLDTEIFAAVEDFLHRSRFATSRPRLKELLGKIWFGLYCYDDEENCTRGSSGFEHVFMFEQKGQDMMGLHNWIFYYWKELNSEMSIKKLSRSQELVPHQRYLLEAELTSSTGATKPISSFIVGSSPEFELAMYTICFFARPTADCPFSVAGGWKSIITTVEKKQGVDTFVRTAYFTLPAPNVIR